MIHTHIAFLGVDPKVDTPLRRALRACRRQFWGVGLFSGVINLL
jgi:ATP-binding cassette, subfamily C, type I secretion system permease/ATPase